MAKVYTRTGDKGTTGIWGGQRLPKHDALINANGDVDESNAIIGVIRSLLVGDDKLNEIHKQLRDVQNDLIVAGSDITNLVSDQQLPCLESKDIEKLEQWIDHYDSQNPSLKDFILPAGDLVVSTMHYARTVIRRTERKLSKLSDNYEVNPCLLGYFNRLSDLLFVLARFTAHHNGGVDEVWVNPKSID